MARHTSIVIGEPIDGDTEATSGKLADKVNDVCDGVTVVSMCAANVGRLMSIVIVWDDA
jgi:hypothetical protein